VAFTVDDFEDLLRLLEQHPEWRARLRRHVLDDELLALPTLVQQIAQSLGALAERVDALDAAQARTEERLDALIAQVTALAAAQARSEERLEVLATSQTTMQFELRTLTDRVAANTGSLLEMTYRDRAAAYFSDLARRIRVLDPSRLADQLDAAVAAGRLTERERRDVLAADLVFSGRRREDDAEAYVLVEVSPGVGEGDVERALRRAQLLARLDRPAVPVVAGHSINPQAEALAQAVGVRQVLDGRGEAA
jgi:hypothetical protein